MDTQDDRIEMEFPQRFAIKAMGENSDDFATHVTALIMAHAGQDAPLELTERNSKNERFRSVTVEIMATSRQQLDAIYQALTDDERVLMAL
ncbi:MAG: DUF493 domain-containing protein [Pseudomonadota bacterium]